MTPEVRMTLTIAAVIVGICMTLSGLLLIGFRRGRLREYNVYIVLSMAALGFARFAEYATGTEHVVAVLATWVNLAIGSAIGLYGMLQIAKSDPPVFGARRARFPSRDAK